MVLLQEVFIPPCTVKLGTTAHIQASPKLETACTRVPVEVSLDSCLAVAISYSVLVALGLQYFCFANLFSYERYRRLDTDLLPFNCCAALYHGRFGQASFNTDDQHTTDDSNNSTGMPATHTDAESSAYQGRFGTMPEAKLFEPQHSGELERKGSAYHGKFSQ